MAAPAFQFYAQDFRASLSVAKMNSAQRGGYIMLLAAAWDHEPQAYLPNDDDDLRLFSGMTETEWEAGRARILKMFPETEDGALRYNKRLLEEAQKQQAYRQSRAKAGQASAAKRWGAGNETVTDDQQTGNRNLTRVTTEVTRVTETGNVGVTLQSSSSSSTSVRREQPVAAADAAARPVAAPPASPPEEAAKPTPENHIPKGSRAKKEKAPPQANCQATIDAYYAWYEKRTGQKPAPTPRDFGALKAIHAHFKKTLPADAPADDIGARFAELLTVWPRRDSFGQARVTPHEIADDLTKLIALSTQPLTLAYHDPASPNRSQHIGNSGAKPTGRGTALAVQMAAAGLL